MANPVSLLAQILDHAEKANLNQDEVIKQLLKGAYKDRTTALHSKEALESSLLSLLQGNLQSASKTVKTNTLVEYLEDELAMMSAPSSKFAESFLSKLSKAISAHQPALNSDEEENSEDLTSYDGTMADWQEGAEELEDLWDQEDPEKAEKNTAQALEETHEVATQLLNELNKLNSQAEHSEKVYEKANQYFETFLEKMATLAEDNKDLIKIKQSITETLTKKNIQLLAITEDSHSLENDERGEMAAALQLKKTRFLSKGLALCLSPQSSQNSPWKAKDRFLMSLATKVTHITHWSTIDTSQLNAAQGNPKRYSLSTQSLLLSLASHLKDSKQAPRLKRLTILGCSTANPEIDQKAKPSPESVELLLSNTKKGNLRNTYALTMIKEPNGTEKLELNHYDAEGQKRSLNLSLRALESANNLASLAGKSKELKKQQAAALLGDEGLQSLHKAIYADLEKKGKYGVTINHEENAYVEERMKTAKDYFEGKKGRDIDKMPTFGNRVITFKASLSEEQKPESLGLIAAKLINKERAPSQSVEVKAYTIPIIPKNERMIPESTTDKAKKTLAVHHTKSLIFKPENQEDNKATPMDSTARMATAFRELAVEPKAHSKNSDNLQEPDDAENSWYSTDQLDKLIYAPLASDQTRTGLRYVFMPKDPNGNPSFSEQLSQLKNLMAQVNAPYACFIATEPAKFNTSHFIVGLVIQNRLLIINPLGETRHHDFYKQIKEATQGQEMLLSRTTIQNDREGITNCGPICAELLRHLSSLSAEQITELVDTLEKTPKSHELFPSYQSIDLTNSSLLPLSLSALVAAKPEEYDERIENLRREQETILNRPLDDKAYDERTLLYQLLLRDLSPSELPGNEEFERLRSHFTQRQDSTSSASPKLDRP